MLLDISLAIADRLLPWGFDKIVPLLRVNPKTLNFSQSEWTSDQVFFLHNRSDDVLFNIYLLVDIGSAKAEAFEINKTNTPKELEISIQNLVVNYEVLRLDLTGEDGRDFILLKIAQIDPKSFLPFQIRANTDVEVKFKMIKSSKAPTPVLSQPNRGAVSFEIPEEANRGKNIQLKRVSLLMKRA